MLMLKWLHRNRRTAVTVAAVIAVTAVGLRAEARWGVGALVVGLVAVLFAHAVGCNAPRASRTVVMLRLRTVALHVHVMLLRAQLTVASAVREQTARRCVPDSPDLIRWPEQTPPV